MCGLAGFVQGRDPLSPERAARLAADMALTIQHRGPDDAGEWADPAGAAALAHRRLSIVDRSPLGHQPMVSSCGRFVIAYNGEVYNAPELCTDLAREGRVPRGHSDTEVLLEGCAAWGVAAAVERCIGMFAFALWDRQRRRMTLVRDRLGIKPLYWREGPEGLLFASELKALRMHPGWRPEIDRDALAAYMRHSYVPSPHCIYRGVRKLEPGCLLEYEFRQPGVRIERYWRLDAVIDDARATPVSASDVEATDALESVLADAVRRRMVADVPLGAFLSGGVDSSTVVALMQRESTQRVRTFSIGFGESGFDEAVHARAVARHLGTEHTELYVGARDALDVVPTLAGMYDEPFADSSQIPTFLVSRMTRDYVTVALSGDGGDELFAGYNRYLHASRTLTGRLLGLPRPLRHLGAIAIGTLSPGAWDSLFDRLPPERRVPQAGDKLYKLAAVLRGGRHSMYRQLVSQWERPEIVVPGAHEVRTALCDPSISERFPDDVERMQYLDAVTYLPDDILTKLDRASMAVSLEARVPLLDHRVVSFAWSLPMHLKLRGGRTKWLLRQVLHRHVPAALIERPKAGFAVPLDAWLRGPLRDWAQSLLAPGVLDADGVLDPTPVRRAWDEHQSGRRNWHYPLWGVLMFLAWKQRWMP